MPKALQHVAQHALNLVLFVLLLTAIALRGHL